MTLIQKIYGSDFSRVLPVKNSDFVIMPTIGQVTVGYLLTCPKTHIEAFSDVSEEQAKDVYQIMEMIKEFNCDVFGASTLFFEHGCSSSRGIQGAASVTHAHLHSIPCTDEQSDKMFELLKSDKNNIIKKIKHFRDLKVAFESHESYVLFIGSNGDMYMVLGKEKWISQYMRKLAGITFDNPNWDWKKCTEPEKDLIQLRDFLFAYDFENRHFCIRTHKEPS